MPRVRRDLPADMNEREGVLGYIRGLVEAVAGKPVDEVPGQARHRRHAE